MEAGGALGGAIIINRRRAHAQGYSSCVSGSGASVRPENAVTYSAGNGGQTICGRFSETAPLQRSNTPSAKGHTKRRPFSCGKRACALCPNSTYVVPRVLHFSASYILRATLAREPIFGGGGGFSPKAPKLPPPMIPPTFSTAEPSKGPKKANNGLNSTWNTTRCKVASFFLFSLRLLPKVFRILPLT